MINLKKNNTFAPEESSVLARTRRGFIIDHVVGMAVLNICNGLYLAGLLRFMGFSDSLNGTVLALPVLGGIFQIVGPLIINTLKNDRPFITYAHFGGKLCLSLVFFLPIIFGNSIIGGILLVAIFSVGHILLAMVAPAVSNWVMLVTPPNKRSGFFTLRERVGLGSMAIAMLIASALLDILASPEQQPMGFALIGILLVLFSIADIFALSRLHKPTDISRSKLSIIDMGKMLLSRDILKVLCMIILWHLSTQIWIPHNNIYLLEYLGVSYSLMGVMNTVSSIAKILLMVLWARYTSRTSFEHSFFISIFIYAVSSLMYLTMTPANANFMIILQILVSSSAWAILGVALFNVQYDNLTGDNKVLKMGLIGGVSGVIGFGISLLGGQIIEAVNDMGGLFILDGQKVVIVIGSIGSFALMALIYYGFIPKDKRPKLRDYLEYLTTIYSRIAALLKDRATRRKYRKERWIH